MKLSMWMIANRLSSLLDLETNISLEAKPILNSARLVYSTNCVHLYQEKDSIICDGEGDTIRIHGLSLKEAFEIIQGVFDYYQDWESRIQEEIHRRNFQAMLDQCDILFQNPMLLMNANYYVLAMSSNYGPDDVDEEWAYLYQYGYSSPGIVRKMRQDQNINMDRYGYQTYHYPTIPSLRYGGVSYNLQFNLISFGRITLLAKNRELNPGDYQLLMKLAGYLEPILSMQSEDEALGYNAFYNLILNRSYTAQELELQMEYMQWQKDDSFQVAVIQPSGFRQSADMPLIMRTLQNHLPYAMVFNKDAQIILLSNTELSKNRQLLDYFNLFLAKEDLRIGFSLFLNDFRQASSLYKQASHALSYAHTYRPDEKICNFHTFAVYYIMDTPYVAERLHACHPVVRKLWQDKKNNQDILYDTLKQYIDQERSLVRTAELLFTHRNTVLYRLKKIMGLLNDPLDDATSRYYIRLSMQCLEMLGNTKY